MDKFKKSIGTVNERSLHLCLKNYIEPNKKYQEVKYKKYVADILRDGEIIEIETRSFSNLRKKMPLFLKEHTVTVVYPIAEVKWIVCMDSKNGEPANKRRSPKKGRPFDVCYELYKLKPFLLNENFRLKLFMIEETDYKLKIGESRGKKSRSRREERILEKINKIIEIKTSKEYIKLAGEIPSGKFTLEEYSKCNKLKKRYAWYVLNLLQYAGIITRAGKKGKAFLYERL